jgi:hypothetical protein
MEILPVAAKVRLACFGSAAAFLAAFFIFHATGAPRFGAASPVFLVETTLACEPAPPIVLRCSFSRPPVSEAVD